MNNPGQIFQIDVFVIQHWIPTSHMVCTGQQKEHVKVLEFYVNLNRTNYGKSTPIPRWLVSKYATTGKGRFYNEYPKLY